MSSDPLLATRAQAQRNRKAERDRLGLYQGSSLLRKVSPQSSRKPLLGQPTPLLQSSATSPNTSFIDTGGFEDYHWHSRVPRQAPPAVVPAAEPGNTKSKMNAQMTTIETVTVVRPLKVISLICLIASLILLLISLFTDYWLKTHSFHTGLFRECVDDISGAGLNPVPFGPAPGHCQPPSRNSAFITVVAVMIIVAAVASLLAMIANLLGLNSNDLHRKYVFYKVATYMVLLAVLCELLSLVGFPVVFFFSMNEYGVRNWEFDWSYGVAWGAMLFSFGASLLLICDKEHEEVYHKEKTIYNPPQEFA
ncbi:PMP-22/EMP/MP20/Claudin family domain-containing protein [Ditylenchus destructor]|nr:PMP-22/EMP/MP20/Claudin family domain-containing protein [Ditylenchus destructor]